MKLQIREFAADDFAEYISWFVDDYLRKELEGIDQEWLNHVLNDPAGRQFVIFEAASEKVIAVVGVCLPDSANPFVVITDIAVRPNVRGSGFGRRSVQMVIDELAIGEGVSWVAYVSKGNTGAQNFFAAIGWRERNRPNEDMLTYVRPEHRTG